jgi:hypothetical protein
VGIVLAHDRVAAVADIIAVGNSGYTIVREEDEDE